MSTVSHRLAEVKAVADSIAGMRWGDIPLEPDEWPPALMGPIEQNAAAEGPPPVGPCRWTEDCCNYRQENGTPFYALYSMGRPLRSRHGATLADHKGLRAPAPSDIRGGPCHCTTTADGCDYTQENGSPFCGFCGPAHHNGIRCACPCQACDPSDSGWSSSDGELDAEAEFLDARHRCHQRKFDQRERRRMRSQLEAVSFAQSLQEHVTIQRDMFYDAREDDIAPGGRRRWMTQESKARQSPLLQGRRQQDNRCARTAWLVLMVSCFCLFAELGNGDQHESSGSGVDAAEDGGDPGDKMQAAHKRTDRPIAEVGTSDESRLHNADAAAAKWLKWQKTRDEVFGRAGNEHCTACSLFVFSVRSSDQLKTPVRLNTWDIQVPGTNSLVAGTWYVVPGTWYQVLGIWHQVPGTWYQAQGRWCQVLGNYQVQCTRYQVQCALY